MQLAPLNQLNGVALGMTLDSLRRARPAARPAEYVGMVEQVGQDSVFFRFDGEAEAVSGYGAGLRTLFAADAPLTAIDVWRRFPSNERARFVRDSIRAEVEHQLGGPRECFVKRGPIEPLEGAVWATSTEEVGLLYTPEWTSPSRVSGNHTYKPRLRIVLGRRLRQSFPGINAAADTACNQRR